MKRNRAERRLGPPVGAAWLRPRSCVVSSATKRGGSVVLLVAILTFYPLVSASASCGEIPTIETALAESETVFVGTVTSLENGRRWATVEVEDVWKGEIVSAEVEVRAGPGDPPGPQNVATSADRHYKLGRQYLFFPFRGDGAVYRDNACTATSAFRPALESFRPPSALEVSPSATAGPDGTAITADPNSSAYLWLVGGAVVLVVAGGLLWRRFGSR